MLADSSISANHSLLWEKLKFLNQQKQLPHAMLFEGPFGVGKATFAKAFAKELLGSNSTGADLYVLKPETQAGFYTIDQIRFIQKLVECTPYEGHQRVFILHDADKLGTAPSNAFLKLVEEPPAGNIFLFLSARPYQILPTLKSRLQKFLFAPMSPVEFEKALLQSGLNLAPFTPLAEGSIGKAKMIEAYKGVLEAFFQLLPHPYMGHFAQYRQYFETLESDETFDFLAFFPLFEDLLRDFGLFHLQEHNPSKLPWLSRSASSLCPQLGFSLAKELATLHASLTSHVKLSSALDRFFIRLWDPSII